MIQYPAIINLGSSYFGPQVPFPTCPSSLHVLFTLLLRNVSIRVAAHLFCFYSEISITTVDLVNIVPGKDEITYLPAMAIPYNFV